MLAFPGARSAQKIWLSSTAIVPILKHHVEHFRLAVDDDTDRRLARARREERASYIPDENPRCGLDGGPRFTGSPFAEGDGAGHVEIRSTLLPSAKVAAVTAGDTGFSIGAPFLNLFPYYFTSRPAVSKT